MLAPVSGLTCSRRAATEQIRPSKKRATKRGERTTFWAKTTTERLKKKGSNHAVQTLLALASQQTHADGFTCPDSPLFPFTRGFYHCDAHASPIPASCHRPKSPCTNKSTEEQLGTVPRRRTDFGAAPPPRLFSTSRIFSFFFLTRAGAHLAFSARRPRAVSSCCLSSGSPGPEPAAGRSPASLGGNTKG